MHFGTSEPGDDVDWEDPCYVGDPRRAYDGLRERCPVAKRDDGTWLITGHEQVRRCALSPDALSNQVSSRLQIPNGLDGDEHRRFRKFVDRFFEPPRIAELLPRFREIAAELSAALPRRSPVDAVWQVGAPLAVRFQCEWLAWPPQLEPELLRWMADYRSAQSGSDTAPRARAAARFDELVGAQLRARERAAAPGDVTGELWHSTIEDPLAPGGRRRLTEQEAISILRNWTAGDLGTLAACTGVVLHRLAQDRELQDSLRASLSEDRMLDRVIDECLRLDDPFLWNRRVAVEDFELGGKLIPAGARVWLNWTAANRDPKRFVPDEFRPEENAEHNLVYGLGPHVCPGRGLATAQLREGLVALLRSTSAIRLAARESRRAVAPTSGYEHVWVVLE